MYRPAYLYIYIHTHIIHVWQRLKNIGLVTGPGGLFATRLVTESGGLATSPPCDKPVEDCSTLHRGPREGFVTEGPRQRFVTEGGTATNPCFEALPRIYTGIYIYISTHTYTHMYMYTHTHVFSLMAQKPIQLTRDGSYSISQRDRLVCPREYLDLPTVRSQKAGT